MARPNPAQKKNEKGLAVSKGLLFNVRVEQNQPGELSHEAEFL
jgi:hypothetical protein